MAPIRHVFAIQTTGGGGTLLLKLLMIDVSPVQNYIYALLQNETGFLKFPDWKLRNALEVQLGYYHPLCNGGRDDRHFAACVNARFLCGFPYSSIHENYLAGLLRDDCAPASVASADCISTCGIDLPPAGEWDFPKTHRCRVYDCVAALPNRLGNQ
jgi:hypothetical protein